MSYSYIVEERRNEFTKGNATRKQGISGPLPGLSSFARTLWFTIFALAISWITARQGRRAVFEIAYKRK